MSISFPALPTAGQLSSQNGRTWAWSGYAWELVASVAGHAATHGVAGGDAVTITTAQVSDFAAAVAAAAPATTDASLLTSGTLDDSRLSANVITGAALAARQHQTTTALDVIDRSQVNTLVAVVTNAEYFTFFTPAQTMTVSQMSMASSGAASGITLCRFGLYTADGSGNCTLVARSAIDTTIFATGSTVFTRSFSTVGGYPATYTLIAGQRYATAFCLAASGVGTTVASLVNNVVGSVSPRVQGVRTGALDILTTQGSWQYNGAVGHAYWARLS